MKKAKRVTALILSVLMLASAGSVMSVNAADNSTVSEVSATLTQGDYEYYIDDNGNVVISKYNGKGANITIPETLGGKKVKYLSDSAFTENTNVTGIKLPSGLEGFSFNTFSGCTKLVKFITPDDSVKFKAVGGVLFNKSLDTVYKYPQGKSGSYTIPNTVKTIEMNAFGECSKLTSVNIPNSVETIGLYAFEKCTGIKSVVLPDSVKTLKMSAFEECTSLEKVTLSKSLKRIDICVFKDCVGLKSVTIPNNIEAVSSMAFEYCTSLESVNIPNSVKTIENYAFCGCQSLNNVVIPYSVSLIQDSAFADCANLSSMQVDKANSYYLSANNIIFTKNRTTILFVPVTMSGTYTVPSTVKYIAGGAFYASNLNEIIFNEKLISIGNYAFAKCDNLTSIDIPDTVTSIGERAFRDCKYLKNIKLSNSLESISAAAFIGCSRLASVDIPASVKTIEDHAFEYCNSLVNVKLHEGLTSIGSSVFDGSYTKNLFIPKSVTNLHKFAFLGPYQGVTVYGYKNSAAETYAKDNNIKFVAVDNRTLTDKTSKIVVSGVIPLEATLSVSKTANTYKNPVAAYDITLKNNGVTCQPVDIITISIPSDIPNCKVMWLKDDGTVQDMNAKYINGCYVFETDHLSKYALVRESVRLKGDVDNNGIINVVDATDIQKYVVNLTDENGNKFIDVNNAEDVYAADVNGDSVINVVDATLIQKYIVKLVDSL